jgi:hypothetical protein
MVFWSFSQWGPTIGCCYTDLLKFMGIFLLLFSFCMFLLEAIVLLV